MLISVICSVKYQKDALEDTSLVTLNPQSNNLNSQQLLVTLQKTYEEPSNT